MLDTSSQLSVSPASPPLNQHNHIKPGGGKPDRQLRKKCILQDCNELVAPSMWKNHLNLHTQGVLPGSVPDDWLHENNVVACSHCHHLVASTHLMSHQRKCATPRSNTNTQMDVPLFNDRTAQLPSFEVVWHLHCSTIHHIPAKARPAFAKTLSSTLQDILHTNNEESWLKLFLLPKCVLVSSKRRGRHHKPPSINYLCDLWSKGHFLTLWEHASQQESSKAFQTHTKGSDYNIQSAIRHAKNGLYGKACQVLNSSGIAPNNDTIWHLLKTKHPNAAPPVIPPSNSSDNPSILLPDFNIMSILRSFPKATASGLRIQHLLNAAEVTLQKTICSSLKDIVNLLASGKVPLVVSKFLAGGNLIAFSKDKPGSPPDIRPIEVGETLRRLVGKCLCRITKMKASDFFSPHQLGVACPYGVEKIVHGLRICIEEHVNDKDFVVMKIDLRNAFNLVSRQALLDECRAHFSEIFQWAAGCYGDHPLLLSAMGTLRSESGVQQGDPLGPLLFCLVLHKVVTAIAVDSICSQLSFHSWYMDDGVIAGPKQAALQALSIIKQLGPPLGLFINTSKCELFGKEGLRGFPDEMKISDALNFEILGVPIGDPIFCAKSIAEKRAHALSFWHC